MPRFTDFRFAAIAGAFLLLLVPASGQRGGSSSPPPSTGGNAPSRGPGGPGNQNPNTIGNQPNTPYPVQTQPIFLSGRVMTDDGSEVPRDVAIERVCGATTRTEGHTNSKGYFNIQLGGNNLDALQDASTGGLDDFGRPGNFGQPPGISANTSNYNRQLLLNCELRARAPGYESQMINLATHRELDNPDLGTILLHRIGPDAGTTVSATTLAAPKNAKKAYQKGLDLEKKKKLDQAQASLEQAVEAYPKYADAWFALGRVQAAQGQADSARKSFDQSIQADSKFIPPYIQISMLEFQGQRWQELADITDKAMRLDPFSFPQAFFMNAVANYNLHRMDVAEQSALRAQKLDTHHQIPQISHLLGVIKADRHDYAGAAALMRDYLQFAPQATDAAAVRSQIEGLEKRATASEQQ
jgi:tetratricopeptide (TPR) repeat protein